MPLRDYEVVKDTQETCCICLRTEDTMYRSVEDPYFIICEECAKK